MKNTNLQNSFKTAFVIALLSASLLVGCGSSSEDSEGGSFRSYYSDTSYFNSDNENVRNLQYLGNLYSTEVNGAKDISIPAENKDVDYVIVISNPSRAKDANIKVKLTDWRMNQRASMEEDEKITDFSVGFDTVFNSRLALALNDKFELEKEIDSVVKGNAINNSSRMANQQVDHSDEEVGKIYSINILEGTNIGVNSNRDCELVKITQHCKIFVDNKGCNDRKGNYYSTNTITEEHINGFANEFEKYIYCVLRDNFGNGGDVFWNDIDRDGRLSIVISPVYNCYGSGNVAGIFDKTSFYNTDNPRDMIGIAVQYPNSDYGVDKWYMDARETIAHEMQHIVNFSAKKNSETLWINEGLSVCAEMLYRKKRADNHESTYGFYNKSMLANDFIGNDGRLAYAVAIPTGILSMHEFLEANSSAADSAQMLAHYGLKGLFFFYLYEQYGANYIRDLCQSQTSGESKFTSLNGSERSLGELIVDFNIALTNERTRCLKGDSFLQSISSRYKYSNDLDLDYHFYYGSAMLLDEKVFFDREGAKLNSYNMAVQITGIPTNNGTARFIIRQPKDLYGHSDFDLTFSSTNDADFIVNMIRVTP